MFYPENIEYKLDALSGKVTEWCFELIVVIKIVNGAYSGIWKRVLLKRFIDSRLMVFIAHIRTRRSDSMCKSLHRSWGHSISWVRVWIILNLYCYKAFFIIIILILLLLRTTFWTHQIFTILHYAIFSIKVRREWHCNVFITNLQR